LVPAPHPGQIGLLGGQVVRLDDLTLPVAGAGRGHAGATARSRRAPSQTATTRRPPSTSSTLTTGRSPQATNGSQSTRSSSSSTVRGMATSRSSAAGRPSSARPVQAPSGRCQVNRPTLTEPSGAGQQVRLRGRRYGGYGSISYTVHGPPSGGGGRRRTLARGMPGPSWHWWHRQVAAVLRQ